MVNVPLLLEDQVMATRQSSPPRSASSPPGSPSIVYLLVVGAAKLAAAALVWVGFIYIGAVAGLAVSGFRCSGGVLGEGCSSDNGTLGWLVFGESTAVGIVCGVLILMPARIRAVLWKSYPGQTWAGIAAVLVLAALLVTANTAG